jgi:hypothetical protein
LYFKATVILNIHAKQVVQIKRWKKAKKERSKTRSTKKGIA